jgi:pimeloyl-ACP methyl ester carboxylesterase
MQGTSQNVTPAERIRIVNSWTPVELFPNTSKAAYLAMMKQNAAWFCKDKGCQERIARLIANGSPAVWWNYFAELATTDLSAEVKSLKVPMLVLPSVYDRDSPGFESSKVALDQWNPLDRSVSSLPITVIPMQDCRAYATEDQPAKLEEAIRNWTSTEFK